MLSMVHKCNKCQHRTRVSACWASSAVCRREPLALKPIHPAVVYVPQWRYTYQLGYQVRFEHRGPIVRVCHFRVTATCLGVCILRLFARCHVFGAISDFPTLNCFYTELAYI